MAKAKKAVKKSVKKAAAKKPTAKKAVTKAKVQKSVAPKKASAVKPAAAKPMKLVDLSGFMTPLDDRLVVQLSQTEKVTAGGLIIPDSVSTIAGHREGVVLAVGRGHRDSKGRLRPMDVSKGDRIVFSSMTGAKLDYQDAELMILRETDVMGVIS